MPTFSYSNEPLPPPEEFRRMLREASEQYDPLEELLILERELGDLERQHGLSSARFYARFLAGETGDDAELIGWIGRYEAYQQLKKAISESLKLVVAGPVAFAAD